MFICLMNNGCIKTFKNITTDVKKDIKIVLLTDTFIKNAMSFIDATFKTIDNKMPKIMIRIERYIKPVLYNKLMFLYNEYRDEIIKILLMMYADINTNKRDFILSYYKEQYNLTTPRQLTLDDLPDVKDDKESPVEVEETETNKDEFTIKNDEDLKEEVIVKKSTPKRRTPRTKKKSS